MREKKGLFRVQRGSDPTPPSRFIVAEESSPERPAAVEDQEVFPAEKNALALFHGCGNG
jgi:hypothetical protein